MRKFFITALIALIVGVPAVIVNAPAKAGPGDEYTGTHFGAGNLPPGCISDMSLSNPNNHCFHMRTGLNALDSPQVDVAIVVPASPTAERDMRIMRQSVEMWENGIHYLADQMGLTWMQGMQFHITVDAFDPTGKNGGEFTTYPLVDPEIVVLATNPVGGAGIGIDPVSTAAPLANAAAGMTIMDENAVPCHHIQNPFDFSYWEHLPGFSKYHSARAGTYVEDCGGAGGNVCFAINGAIDPAPGVLDVFGLFDLVSHEFGHCLTLGHVGDGAEGAWGPLPSNDIMAYSTDPPGGTKCVSTLDVEGIALRMSKYLDVNGDGVVNSADQLKANDPVGVGDPLGQGSNSFQVQNPRDHWYASATGSPLDCPQPDVGLVPGPRTNWTPTPVATSRSELTVTSPADGTAADPGTFNVKGTAEHVSLHPAPTSPTGHVDDATNDATTPYTEIKALDVAANPTRLDATMSLADLQPSTDVTSPTSYSVTVNGRKFDSFVRYPIDSNPMTWDNGSAGYMPAGTSTWDLAAKTVSFHIPRDFLASVGIEAPYYVSSQSSVGALSTEVPDDHAPNGRDTVGVAGASAARLPGHVLGTQAQTVTFEHPGGNTFHTEESTAGLPSLVTGDPSHHFSFDVGQLSDIEFTLDWTDAVGGSDLDLHAGGAADSGSDGATSAKPESFTLKNVKGTLDLRVTPSIITDPVNGSTYTLTAAITPVAPPPDADGDGVADSADACPSVAGAAANGCPPVATEHVHVYVDGTPTANQDIDTLAGPAAFDIPVALQAAGTHELRVEWERNGKILATRLSHVTINGDDDHDGVTNPNDKCPGFDDRADMDHDGTPDGCDPDQDGDGVANKTDNCSATPNPNQANLDRDALGDACDPDIDGDGWTNAQEQAAGTDPMNAKSHPKKRR